MRKKTVTHVADTIFWYILYFLPIILTLIQSIGLFENFGFDSWQYVYDEGNILDYDFLHLLEMNLNSFYISRYNIISSALMDIFGLNGFIPIFSNNLTSIIQYFGYFVGVYLIHLCVDFILFIPRIAHKWLNKFTRECE